MPYTADRGDIIHFAGRHRLSPVLRDGVPALAAIGDPGQRVGWAEFFAELRARKLVASFDPEDAASFRLVPAGASGPADAARAHDPHGPGALAQARRFLDALRGRFPPA